MASNTTVVVDKGKSRITGNKAELPNRSIDTQAVKNQAEATSSNASPVQREVGDHVNRFLLCSLVSESAKRIKVSAGKMGETWPMTLIVRRVLSSYLLAAKDKYGPLAGSELDMDGLRILNASVLRNEIKRLSQEKVKSGETRPSPEKHFSDKP